MSVIFNLEKEFEIGDLKIKAYQYEHVTLFDPKYLIELVGDEFKENNSNSTKQRILKRINPEFIVKVDVREGGDNAPLYIGKKLLKAQGVYQLLFFLNSDTANKICKSFVDILESYRMERGLTFDRFLRGSYEGGRYYLPNNFDSKSHLSNTLIEKLKNIPEEDLYIMETFKFPVINGFPVTDLQYEFDNSDDLKLGIKVDFYVSCEKCIQALSKIENRDKVTTLESLLRKELRAYNIDQFYFKTEENMATGMYFDGLELFNALMDMENYGGFDFIVKLFSTMMKIMYKDEKIVNLLVNSVTKYHFINKNIPTKRIIDYVRNEENLYV